VTTSPRSHGLLRVDGDVSTETPSVATHLADCLARLNRGAGSATRIERLLLLTSPPSIDAGEITDKGYINQGAVRANRADSVQRLLATPPDRDVIRPWPADAGT